MVGKTTQPVILYLLDSVPCASGGHSWDANESSDIFSYIIITNIEYQGLDE